jgi:hypothetical protein
MDFCSIEDAWRCDSYIDTHTNTHSVDNSPSEPAPHIPKESGTRPETETVANRQSENNRQTVEPFDVTDQNTVFQRMLADPKIKNYLMREMEQNSERTNHNDGVVTIRDMLYTFHDIWDRNVVDGVRRLGLSKELKEKLLLVLICLIVLVIVSDTRTTTRRNER